MGVSAGGYASILFGSLCNNVDYVVSFLPQTILKNPIDINYVDLKNILNSQTKYILYGDPNITNVNNIHNIYHCENIEKNSNVTVLKKEKIDLKKMRDNGDIKNILDELLLF